MAKKSAGLFYGTITSAGGQTPNLETHKFFNSAQGPLISPVDRFLENCNDINKVSLSNYLTGSTKLPSELSALAILGYVSATESYFRAIISGLIFIDEYTQLLVERKMLSYGAAVHHTEALLPEALLEGTTFSAATHVKSALKDYLHLNKNETGDIDQLLKVFQKICELRHCCVHRFGRLGSNNAINLGLSEHKKLLEARIELDVNQLQDVALALRIFVKSINAIIFRAVLERSAKGEIRDESFPFKYPIKWSWRWPSDRRRFSKYYDLFASTLDTTPSQPAKVIYDDFRAQFR